MQCNARCADERITFKSKQPKVHQMQRINNHKATGLKNQIIRPVA